MKKLQSQILSRYEKEGRDFPRRKTKDPYAIHICEVMSQQTQLSRVLPYRQKRMQDIPNYGALAKIGKAELLKHRSGLGFNSRALRLQECAKVVVERYRGRLPESREELLKLPGIGPYTASAICAFAWNQAEVVIDTNIRRVLIFLLKLDEDISMKELGKIAKKLIPPGRSRDWHNALMDYGAVYLTARKTKIKSVSKQSKFEGSDREVRGWIVKQLVTPLMKGGRPDLGVPDSAATGGSNDKDDDKRRDASLMRPNGKAVSPPTSRANKGLQPLALTLDCIQSEFPRKDVEKIVQGLVDEGVVEMREGIVRILE